MSLRRTWYMHTVLGWPAYFHEGDQIVYRADRRHPAALVPTIQRLRGQQKRSMRARRADGFTDDPKDYGYVRVVLPEVRRG